MLTRPLFIGSDIYRASSYGRKHPLSIPRVSTVIDLSRAMGWLDHRSYLDSPMATPDQLARFHDRSYIETVRRAEAEQRLDPESRDRFNIGKLENPIFAEVFRRPATASGGSIMAGRLLAEHEGVIYNPAGGTHHGRRDRASGFCYFNDPVLGILTMLDGGVGRVYYVDLDAHHGDGVEFAFADDDRVLTVSVHEAGRWPHTGKVEDRAGGLARNLPVPVEFNDSEMDYILETALLPLGRGFRPDAVVVQCGADSLAEDPMSRLNLSNGALWAAVSALSRLAPRVLVLGGGGYNPWSVGRCWAGVWATLNGIDPDVPVTGEAEEVLRTLTWTRRQGQNPPEHWFTTIADPPRPGPVRDEIRRIVETVME
jgi:acetoin utilization protein AcuC